MGVSLKKGQGVSLSKSEFNLSKVTMGLGWDVTEEKNSFLSSMLGKKPPEEYDLDAVAFLVDTNGKVNLGPKRDLVDGDVIFFNSMQHSSGQIWLTGDNRTGAGEGDDEQIIVNLSNLDARYSRVVFIVQIYAAKARDQNFGKVKNAYIRALDSNGKEMVRFDVSGDATYANCRSILFAELVREGDGWKFSAVGKPYESDSFTQALQSYC